MARASPHPAVQTVQWAQQPSPRAGCMELMAMDRRSGWGVERNPTGGPMCPRGALRALRLLCLSSEGVPVGDISYLAHVADAVSTRAAGAGGGIGVEIQPVVSKQVTDFRLGGFWVGDGHAGADPGDKLSPSRARVGFAKLHSPGGPDRGTPHRYQRPEPGLAAFGGDRGWCLGGQGRGGTARSGVRRDHGPFPWYVLAGGRCTPVWLPAARRAGPRPGQARWPAGA